MTYRFATLDDLPRLMDLGFEALTAYPKFREFVKPDPVAIENFFKTFIEAPPEQAALFVIGAPGDAHGMLGVVKVVHPFSGEFFANEILWWVSPKRRGNGVVLYRAMKDWARFVGAKKLQAASPTKKLSRVLKRLGFASIETTFIMKVE